MISNIKNIISNFDSVEKLKLIIKDGISGKANLYIVKLWDNVGIYEFKNDMDSNDELKYYVILSNVPGHENDPEYIGVIDAATDVFSALLYGKELPKRMRISNLMNGSKSYVDALKKVCAIVDYNRWIQFKPCFDDIKDYIIDESLNESFKSEKLVKFAKEHGGLINGEWSARWTDLYNMTDDDFDEYVIVDKNKHYNEHGFGGWGDRTYDNSHYKPIEFADGTFIIKSNPSLTTLDSDKELYNKRKERYNRQYDKDEYQYENPYLNKLISKDNKPRGYWGYGKDSELGKNDLNIQAIRQKHNDATYYGKERDENYNKIVRNEFIEDKDDERSLINKVKNHNK